jgi:hypothetical protein
VHFLPVDLHCQSANIDELSSYQDADLLLVHAVRFGRLAKTDGNVVFVLGWRFGSLFLGCCFLLTAMDVQFSLVLIDDEDQLEPKGIQHPLWTTYHHCIWNRMKWEDHMIVVLRPHKEFGW